MWRKVSNEKIICLIYKYLHDAAFYCVAAHDWLVISVISVECSVLCRSIWLLAGVKMSCLSDSPDFWCPGHQQIFPDCLVSWESAGVDGGGGHLLASVPALCWTLTWAAAPPPCSPWLPAGVAQVTWQAGSGMVCLQAGVGPWPASGTPVRSWAFSSPSKEMKQFFFKLCHSG